MAKILLTDTVSEIMVKMSEGNPGALACLVDLFKNNARIDPDSAMGDISTILDLDEFAIYGSSIYVIWNDICLRDTAKMIGIFRACQLGFISSKIIKDAASRQDRSGANLIPVDELMKKVGEELPNFNQQPAEMLKAA